ncbi:MAG TPA: response regulator transcription factor [Chthoniobacterales bacterium]|nr:response regulator transcription factor [Chthoniobacterales bacterium]
MAITTKSKQPKRPARGKKSTSGSDATEARRQAIQPGVKSTGGLGSGPVANPKCALPESIRIVVVDDHPLFRHGLIQLLNSDDGFAVCGEASAAAEALDVVRKVKPNLVIADLGLKGPNGIELTKSIMAEFPRLPVLILSMHDESLYAVRSLRAGARGYVTKQEALGSVLEAVRHVMDGQTYLSPKMASQVISKVVVNRIAPDEEITDRLSDRELEVLEMIGAGKEVKAIAKALHLSPKTVETHRTHIKEKLNLENARQVARFAVQWVAERAV